MLFTLLPIFRARLIFKAICRLENGRNDWLVLELGDAKDINFG